MHIVFIHFHFPSKKNEYKIYDNFYFENAKVSIVQRNNHHSVKENFHYVKDEFDQELRWWQHPEKLNEYIAQFKPDIVYIFGLNLPLHFRWLKHYLPQNTIIIAQYCGEDIWIQKNLWLQQFGLRVVNGFVFTTQKDANSWRKCAAILDSQPVFELNEFKNGIAAIYSNLSKSKTFS